MYPNLPKKQTGGGEAADMRIAVKDILRGRDIGRGGLSEKSEAAIPDGLGSIEMGVDRLFAGRAEGDIPVERQRSPESTGRRDRTLDMTTSTGIGCWHANMTDRRLRLPLVKPLTVGK